MVTVTFKNFETLMSTVLLIDAVQLSVILTSKNRWRQQME